MSNLEIVVSGSLPRPQIELSPSAFNAREVALSAASQVKEITSVTDLDDAARALTNIKRLTKSIEDSRKEVKAPVLEVGRSIDAVAKDYLSPLEAEAKRLSVMVGSYQEAERRKADRIRQEEARRQAEAIEEMQREQQKAIISGNEEEADQARAKAADTIAESQLKVIAAEGPKAEGISTRTNWKFEVVDIESLHAARPDLTIVEPNNAAIRAIIKASNGKAIAGLRIWSEAAAVVRTTSPVKVDQFDY